MSRVLERTTGGAIWHRTNLFFFYVLFFYVCHLEGEVNVLLVLVHLKKGFFWG